MVTVGEGYDVKLGTNLLRLARRSDGGLALRWPDAPDEAGVKGQLGTIPFTELHHGIGPDVVAEGDRYTIGERFSAMRPGRLEPLATVEVVVDGDTQSPNTGSCETTRIFASSFQWEGDVYFILPQKILKIEGGTLEFDDVTITGITGSDYIRGPAAFYNGDWFIGLENSDGQSVGHIQWDPDSDTWMANKGAGANKASLFFSVHTFLWSLQTVTAGAKKAACRWKLRYTDASDAALDSSFTDATTEKSEPFPTAIYPFGRWILIFGAAGEILAASETPPLKALVPPGMLSAGDPEFGVGARQWGENLLIPCRRTMYRITLDEAGPRDYSPAGLQGGLGHELSRPSALAPYGPDLLVGTRSRTDDSVQLLGLRQYPDGAAYNELATLAVLTGAHATRGLEVLASGHVYLLAGNASEGRVRRLAVSPATGGRPPSTLKGTSHLKTSYTFGGSRSRKLFLGVRGWAEDKPPGDNALMGVYVSVDGGTYLLTASVWAAGPFSGSNKQVGYTASIQPYTYVADGEDDYVKWGVFLGPIYLDYMELPASGLHIQLDVDAGGMTPTPFGRPTSRREQLLATLKPLEGTSVTLALLESEASYTVIVETVEAYDQDPTDPRGGAKAIIRVTGRIV